MPKKTISLSEPAERPVSIALSLAELHALVLHHKRQIKRVSNVTGKIVIQERRHLKSVLKAAEEQVQAHAARGKGLVTLLHEHL